jgi:hypothetical protein
MEATSSSTPKSSALPAMRAARRLWAEREFAYDAHPPASGTLVTALAAAPLEEDSGRHENDWTRVFAH